LKLLLPLCFVLSFQAAALAADHSLEYQVNCDTAEARNLKGSQGSCRVLLTPKKVNQEGSCAGFLEDKYFCRISYNGEGSSSSNLNVFCASGAETILDEDMSSDSIEYNVTTIIKGNGGISLIDDPNIYTIFNNRLLEMKTVRSASGQIQGKITFNFDYYSLPLTNVVCE